MLISLLSCSPGEWAGRHSSAAGSLLQGQNFCPLHVPHTNVPPLHWCDWWAGSTYTFDERSADSCGPCVGPLGQGLQGCCDVSPIPPTANHFSLPQNLCSTAKGAFLFSILKWLLAQDGFPRTVAAGICVQLQSSEDPLEMDSGRVFQLRSFSCSRAAWNMYNHYVLLFILTLYKMKLCVICLILNGLNRFLFNSFNLLTRYKIGLSQKLFLSVKGWGGWLLAWLYCDYDS